MPILKTVSVTYERKQNLGDFSSATIGTTVWADVEEGEDLNLVMHDLWDFAKTNVKTNLLPLTNKANTELKEAFLGLPVQAKSYDKEAQHVPEPGHLQSLSWADGFAERRKQ